MSIARYTRFIPIIFLALLLSGLNPIEAQLTQQSLPIAIYKKYPVDIIVNGGFETGDFTGWTTSGTVSISLNAYEGSYSASMSGGGLIEQMWGYKADVNVSFAYLNTYSGTTGYFEVSYDNSTWTLYANLPYTGSTTSSWATASYIISGIYGIRFRSDASNAIGIDAVTAVRESIARVSYTSSSSGNQLTLSFNLTSYSEAYIVYPKTYELSSITGNGVQVNYSVSIGDIYRATIPSGYSDSFQAVFNDQSLTSYTGKKLSLLLEYPSTVKAVSGGYQVKVFNMSFYEGEEPSQDGLNSYTFYYSFSDPVVFTAVAGEVSAEDTVYIYFGYSVDNTTYRYYYTGETVKSVFYTIYEGEYTNYLAIRLDSATNFEIHKLIIYVWTGSSKVYNGLSGDLYMKYDTSYTVVPPGGSHTFSDDVELSLIHSIETLLIRFDEENPGSGYSGQASLNMTYIYSNGSIVEYSLGSYSISPGSNLTVSLSSYIDVSDMAYRILFDGYTFLTVEASYNNILRGGLANHDIEATIYIDGDATYTVTLDAQANTYVETRLENIKTVDYRFIPETQKTIYLRKGSIYYIIIYDIDMNFIGSYYIDTSTGEVIKIEQIYLPGPAFNTTAPPITSNTSINYTIPNFENVFLTLYNLNPWLMRASILGLIIIFYLVAGRHMGGVIVIVSGVLIWFFDSIMPTPLFNPMLAGTLIFIGIISIIYEEMRLRG